MHRYLADPCRLIVAQILMLRDLRAVCLILSHELSSLDTAYSLNNLLVVQAEIASLYSTLFIFIYSKLIKFSVEGWL